MRPGYGSVDDSHLVVEADGGPVQMALDGSTQPYATRVGGTALARVGITHVTA